MTLRQKRVDLATGLSYSVLEWDASGSDHSVLLVHGFLDSAHSWRAVAEALGDDFHLLAPDMRGHGDSDRVGRGGYYHFFDYVADLASLIETEGRERVSLVGHSMGGSICAYYSGTFPERVHRLALLEGLGPPSSHNTIPQQLKVWIESWKAAMGREPSVYATAQEAAARLRRRDPLLTEELAMELVRHGTEVARGGVRFKHDPVHLSRGPSPYRPDLAAEFWAEVRAPTLLVDGDQSVFRHAEDETARRAGFFADARRATIEGAGHMMQWHQPQKLADTLRDFLRA